MRLKLQLIPSLVNLGIFLKDSTQPSSKELKTLSTSSPILPGKKLDLLQNCHKENEAIDDGDILVLAVHINNNDERRRYNNFFGPKLS